MRRLRRQLRGITPRRDRSPDHCCGPATVADDLLCISADPAGVAEMDARNSMTCVCGCPAEHSEHCVHGCTIAETPEVADTPSKFPALDRHYEGRYSKRFPA